MSNQGPQIDAGKGTGEKMPATGLFVDGKDVILNVGELDSVDINETAIRITRESGDIIVWDGQHEVLRARVD